MNHTEEYIKELIVEREYWRIKSNFYKHQVLTCGVAAEHPDAELSRTGAYINKWDSPQAEAVRKLRAERDQLVKLVEKLRAEMSWEHEAGCSGEYGYGCKDSCGLHNRLTDPDYGMSKHPYAAEILRRDNERNKDGK